MNIHSSFLRFSVLTFFMMAIAFAVLYRCGVFAKPVQTADANNNWFSAIKTKPWFDSVLFNELGHSPNPPRIYSSKSGMAFYPLSMDTITRLELMEMRYALPQLTLSDKMDFEALIQQLKSIDEMFLFKPMQFGPISDSLYSFHFIGAGGRTLSCLQYFERKYFDEQLSLINHQKLMRDFDMPLVLADTLWILEKIHRNRLIQPVTQ